MKARQTKSVRWRLHGIGMPGVCRCAGVWLAVIAAASTVGGCSVERRPAWERAAIGKPIPAGTPRPAAVPPTAAASQSQSQVQTAAQGKGAAPGATTKMVETAPLPPPGGSPAGRSSSSPALQVPPTGAAGRTVAVSTPLPAPPHQAIDPLWVGVDVHAARHEDTLVDLAVGDGLGFIELAMANREVDPWLPGEGTTVVLPKVHLPPESARKGIVLNLPEQRLYYYEKEALVRSYPIGIGRDGHSTPLGITSIVRKQTNPTWYPTPGARAGDPTLPAAVPPGPDNPLGNRAMYLGWTSYLIHGTNKEFGIGRRASRGCIRMYARDVIALYDRAGVGTPVAVVDQPIRVGWHQGELVMAASPTMQQVRAWEEEGKLPPVEAPDVRPLVLGKAGAAADRIDWAVVDRVVAERRGIPTRISQLTARPELASVATGSPPPVLLPPGSPPPGLPSPGAPSGRPVPPAPAKALPADQRKSPGPVVAYPAAPYSVVLPTPGSPPAGPTSASTAAPAAAAPVNASSATGAAPAAASAAARPVADQHPDDLVKWLRERLGTPGR